MAFCSKCGRRLNSDARFCPGCGLQVSGTDQPSSDYRKETWEGSVHKCPRCGAPVGSFEAYCSACGNELRDKEAADSVAELSKQLDQIESGRNESGKKKKEQGTVSDIDQRKINLIRTYPIPNTVEDILEFVILASSNVEPEAYSVWSSDVSGKAVSEAWITKCNQAIHKAEVSFGDSPLVEKMHKMCADTLKSIRTAKNRGIRNVVAATVGPLLLITLLVLMLELIEPGRTSEEIARLEEIVDSIEQDLENGEYYRALLNAESLDASEYVSEETQRQWNVNREYWIDRVVNEAAENGIDLSGKVSDLGSKEQDSEEDQNSEESQTGGFVDGLMNGVEHGLSEAQKNIDEFTQAISSVGNGTDGQQSLATGD